MLHMAVLSEHLLGLGYLLDCFHIFYSSSQEAMIASHDEEDKTITIPWYK